jgi:hypothetical protein
MEDRKDQHLVGDVPVFWPELVDDDVREGVDNPFVRASDQAGVNRPMLSGLRWGIWLR